MPELERVPLNATARLDLASSWPGKPTQQLHQVTWSHAEHTPQVFLISSYLSNSEVTVIGLSPLGQELWRVFLTPGKPIAASGIEPFDDKRLAQAIVADLQLQRWPLASVNSRLHNARLVNQGTDRSVVTTSGEIIWQAQAHANLVTIANKVRGYTLKLELLDEQAFTTKSKGE